MSSRNRWTPPVQISGLAGPSDSRTTCRSTAQGHDFGPSRTKGRGGAARCGNEPIAELSRPGGREVAGTSRLSNGQRHRISDQAAIGVIGGPVGTPPAITAVGCKRNSGYR